MELIFVLQSFENLISLDLVEGNKVNLQNLYCNFFFEMGDSLVGFEGNKTNVQERLF